MFVLSLMVFVCKYMCNFKNIITVSRSSDDCTLNGRQESKFKLKKCKASVASSGLQFGRYETVYTSPLKSKLNQSCRDYRLKVKS